VTRLQPPPVCLLLQLTCPGSYRAKDFVLSDIKRVPRQMLMLAPPTVCFFAAFLPISYLHNGSHEDNTSIHGWMLILTWPLFNTAAPFAVHATCSQTTDTAHPSSPRLFRDAPLTTIDLRRLCRW